MQGKKYIAMALVCGFVLGSSTAPVQAGILGTVLKGGAIGVLVNQFDDQLNSAINTLTGLNGQIRCQQRLCHQGCAGNYRRRRQLRRCGTGQRPARAG